MEKWPAHGCSALPGQRQHPDLKVVTFRGSPLRARCLSLPGPALPSLPAAVLLPSLLAPPHSPSLPTTHLTLSLMHHHPVRLPRYAAWNAESVHPILTPAGRSPCTPLPPAHHSTQTTGYVSSFSDEPWTQRRASCPEDRRPIQFPSPPLSSDSWEAAGGAVLWQFCHIDQHYSINSHSVCVESFF